MVLDEAALLSEEELLRFRAFVERGGRLMWTGLTGTRDEQGVQRDAGFLETCGA